MFIMALAVAFTIGIAALVIRIVIGVCKFIGYMALAVALPFMWVITGILWVVAKVVNTQATRKYVPPHIVINVVDEEPRMKDITPRVRQIR